LPPSAVGFDIGCGTGRWARQIAPRVHKLHCIDASPEALAVAKTNLRELTNCEYHCASVDAMPLPDSSMDFGYALGVLHHVPDTAAGIRACASKLKPGAPLLLYLYYAFDNRPSWYRLLWALSDRVRRVTSRLPRRARFCVSQVLACAVYYPLARASSIAERIGLDVTHFPLAAYRDRSFYSMRTDALDRFGTRLEQRFSAREIRTMMEEAGLERITISSEVPYWCAVGYRASPNGERLA